VTSQLLDLPGTETRDQVAAFRARFQRAIDAGQPAPAARAWRCGRFERGLKIADELELRLGSLMGKRILDVGAAHGGDVVALCARGATCVGADKFDYGYDRLKSLVAVGKRLDFRLYDCTAAWPFADKSFDVVLCLAVIEHVDDLAHFFAELLRVVKPGGLVVLETATALRNTRRDNLYHLPLISLLPTPLRRLIGETVFRRHYPFHVSRHTFYAAGKFKRLAARHGFAAAPCKYADSRLAARVARWPVARLWRFLLCHFAFDFILIRPRRADAAGPAPGCRADRTPPSASAPW
jgi:SAM-dependent methyltransferase